MTDAAMNEDSLDNAKSMSLLVTKGTLDWGYPPFILATTAAAMGLNTFSKFVFFNTWPPGYSFTISHGTGYLHSSTVEQTSGQLVYPLSGSVISQYRSRGSTSTDQRTVLARFKRSNSASQAFRNRCKWLWPRPETSS